MPRKCIKGLIPFFGPLLPREYVNAEYADVIEGLRNGKPLHQMSLGEIFIADNGSGYGYSARTSMKRHFSRADAAREQYRYERELERKRQELREQQDREWEERGEQIEAERQEIKAEPARPMTAAEVLFHLMMQSNK